MTGRGYKCLDCDCVSDLISDWIVTEDDVVCVECGSTNVEPEDIEKGVILITKADEIKRMTDDEVNEYFDELISTMPEKEFEEWASGWYEWQQEACSIAKEWDADTKREDLLLIIGEYEADSKEEAEELAMDDLPLNTDDYIEREEFIVEEVEDE